MSERGRKNRESGPRPGRRIESVKVLKDERALSVSMDNGRTYKLPIDDLSEADSSDVRRVTVGRSRGYFRVHQESGNVFEVPWDEVLFHCEPEYEFFKGRRPAEDDRPKVVGNRVRALRTSKGLSVTALAERAGMKRPNLSRLESGRHLPSLETLERIARALRVPVAELLVVANHDAVSSVHNSTSSSEGPSQEEPSAGESSEAFEADEERQVPSWLSTPPTEPAHVLIVSRPQILPIEHLRWDNFEKLTFRLVRSRAEIDLCRLYGTPGQNQHGIDFLARLEDGSYSVFQCKQRDSFAPADIRAAVNRYLNGRWASISNRFVLCVSADLTRTECQDEIVTQANRLAATDTRFDVWDQADLSVRLKDYPELVDDFFGRSVVESFLGKEAAASLGQRLDVRDVLALRESLQGLYETVFASLDPGIGLSSSNAGRRFDLLERFVVPEVRPQLLQFRRRVIDETSAPSGSRPTTDTQTTWAESADSVDFPSRSQASRPREDAAAGYAPREALDIWLAAAERAILVGDAGAGKTATLRYLTLDLLAPAPALGHLASHWGDRLPVWIPFAYWTRLIARSDGRRVSLEECARSWLETYDREDIWPLVERAIKDDRLLLIVDGLDESLDDDSGRVATHLLQVYVEERGIAAILAARPHVPLQNFDETWRRGHLAELSDEQKRSLIGKWFAFWETTDQTPELYDVASIQDEERRFLMALQESADLQALAQVPLLLGLLLLLWFERSDLPRHRFEAYDRVLDHLLREHPLTRRVAALVPEAREELSAAEARVVLARLAFELQASAASDFVEDRTAVSFVREVLCDEQLGLGLPVAAARPLAERFISIASESLGILVRVAPREVGFVHRSIRDFLAGQHLARLPLDVQQAIVTERATSLKWREALLSLLWSTPRPDDLEKLVDAIGAQPSGVDADSAAELAAEIGFGPFHCSPVLIRRITGNSFERVQRGERLGHRRALLGQILGGLEHPVTRTPVLERLHSWIYARGLYRPSMYSGLSRWPRTDETRDVLWTALHDEDESVQQVAARVLPQVFSSESDLADALCEVASRSQLPSRRAAALEALLAGWPDRDEIPGLIKAGLDSPSPSVRVVAVKGQILRGEHDVAALNRVLEIVHEGRFARGPWVAEIPLLLAQGWKGFVPLRDECLKGAQRHGPRGEGISYDVASEVLLRAFPQDEAVAEWCAHEITRENHPFLMLRHEGWHLVVESFRDHPRLVAAIDEWAPRQQFREPELSYAAQVGRTPIVKRTLLNQLRESSLPHWPASGLLEGWGMEDPEVAHNLRAVAMGNERQASAIAHLIPRILQDSASARGRLLQILAAPSCVRPDFVALGLADLKERSDESEIVTTLLRVADERRAADVEGTLFVEFAGDDRVRALALSRLDQRDPPIGAIAWGYSDDEEMRKRVKDVLCPLPVSLRAFAIQALGRARLSDRAVTELLGSFDVEQDAEVKLLASIGFHERLARTSTVSDRVIARLGEMIGAYGHDYEDRRRAAFVGLTLLNRLDLMLAVKEGIGDPVPGSVAPDWRGRSGSFMSFVAEHWTELKNTFGNDLVVRLSRRNREGEHFWEALSEVARDFPSVHPDLFGALAENPRLLSRPAVLRFLGAVRPGSRALRDACVSVLRGGGGFSYAEAQPLWTAAEIVADQFLRDPEVVDWLMRDGGPRLHDEGRVLTLCYGWLRHPILEALYEELKKSERYPVSYPVGFSVTYSTIPSDQLPSRLSRDLDILAHNDLFADYVRIPLMRRLRQDSDAVRSLAESLVADATSSTKASVPSILASVGGISANVTDWCRNEIARQMREAEYPELGYDLMSGAVRGVAVSLLDALA